VDTGKRISNRCRFNSQILFAFRKTGKTGKRPADLGGDDYLLKPPIARRGHSAREELVTGETNNVAYLR
jgi:hypothetical protein